MQYTGRFPCADAAKLWCLVNSLVHDDCRTMMLEQSSQLEQDNFPWLVLIKRLPLLKTSCSWPDPEAHCAFQATP